MGASAISFTAPDAATANLLRLVASYGQCEPEPSISIQKVETVEFSDQTGNQFKGVLTACRFIASICPDPSALLGRSPEQRAKVFEWLTFALTELTPLLDDKLVVMNDWLLTRTFLAGSQPTLADLVLYAFVSPAAVGFPVAQHVHFCNLLRWYDHIHAVADTLNLFPAAKIQKTNFAPPPPLAPAPAKPAKAASVPSTDNGGKKKEPSTANGPAPSAPAAANEAAGESTNESKKKEAKKKDTPAAAPATPATSTSNNEKPSARSSGPTIDVLDIRIGRIVGVKPHPNADSLYVEDIDLGEEQPRQVVSGLRKFVPLEAMQGRRVVVVCNLKPAKMRDVMSYGMVLCASNSDHTQVDPILPPEGAAVGERVKFEGYSAEPDAQINPKKKIMEKVGPDLVTDAAGVCQYRGTPFMTSHGAVTASIPGAHIA